MEPIDVFYANRKRSPKRTDAPAKSGAQPTDTCRSCRGLLVYAPLLTSTAVSATNTWRSNQPTCIGLSTAAEGITRSELEKIDSARQVPPGQQVDFLMVLGHAVWDYSGAPGASESSAASPQQGKAPACYKGLELLSFSKNSSAQEKSAPARHTVAAAAPASAALAYSASLPEHGASDASAGHSSSSSSSPLGPLPNDLRALLASAAAFASSVRVLTSSNEANSKLQEIYNSMASWSHGSYADKFISQANKNAGIMTKWIQDLRTAVVGGGSSSGGDGSNQQPKA